MKPAKTVMDSDRLAFVVDDRGCEEDRHYIHEQIRAFNDAISEPHRAARAAGRQSLDIFVRDREGRLLGGLVGWIYWGWLEIDDLWLPESLRGRGYGRRLVGLAEAEARQRGCSRAWLRTFSFQARGFYEKLGYRVVGALEDYPPGATFYWLRKDLALADPVVPK